MASSGTYAWNPQIGDIVINAYARCGIRGPELTAQHLQDAATECNLLSVQFSNRNPSQYALETTTIPLVQGQAVYSLLNRVLAVAIVTMTVNYGTASAFDRVISPISSTDFAAIPNKTTQGPPTICNTQLLPIPTITFWPTPDGNGPYQANILAFRHQQDVSISGGQTMDLSYHFLDAFTAGLAARLARIYAPALYPMRKQDWEDAWNEVAEMDQTDDSLYIVAGLDSYYR